MKWQTFNRIEFALTTHCNANCPLCMRTDKNSGKKLDSVPLLHLPLDDYKKTLKQINSDWQIYLCGDWGDPMMHPNIEEILEYTVINNSNSVCIDTNGGIRDADFYKKIAKKYEEELWINFSIDGFDAETNGKYRIGVNFDKCMENILAYAQQSPWLSIWQMLIFDYNYDQIDMVADFCRKNKIFFDFKLNVRRWKHTVTSEKIKEYVLKKQQEHKDICYENSL